MAVTRISAFLVGVFLVIVGAQCWAQGGAWTATTKGLKPVPQSTTPAAPGAAPTAGAAQPCPSPLPPEVPCDQCDNGAPCDEGCCMPSCSPPGRVWARGDYLMWWTKGSHLPPLVTTSPAGTPLDRAGVLGVPGTTVLFGNSTVANDGRSGFRGTVGLWLDDCHDWGAEFDYFSLGDRDANYSATSDGNPILARPLYDVEAGQQGRELVAYPDQLSGTVTVGARDYFQSAGVDLTYRLCGCDSCCQCPQPCDPCGDGCSNACCAPTLFCCRTDLIFGYRYYNLSDSVAITENLRITTRGPLQNTLFDILDGFRARNDFHGSELGLRTKIYRGRWSLDLLAKCALGNNHQVVNIGGHTTITSPTGDVNNLEGGVLAVRTNQGTYVSDEFTMIPQLGAELGYQLNCHWRVYVGYNILYWGSVMRSADQIDLNVDPRNVPPTQDPATHFPQFLDRTTSFWAHGLNVGTEVRF
jgi:hypothetical protein